MPGNSKFIYEKRLCMLWVIKDVICQLIKAPDELEAVEKTVSVPLDKNNVTFQMVNHSQEIVYLIC